MENHRPFGPVTQCVAGHHPAPGGLSPGNSISRSQATLALPYLLDSMPVAGGRAVATTEDLGGTVTRWEGSRTRAVSRSSKAEASHGKRARESGHVCPSGRQRRNIDTL